jgi:serine protease AprX
MKHQIKVCYVTGMLVLSMLIAMGLCLHQEPGRVESAQRPDKISVNAWIAAQAGQQVDVIVMMKQQVDLHMMNLPDSKQQRGDRVYNILYDNANTSQAAIRAWLTKKGVDYRSYFIVNALQLDADSELLLALSRRYDIQYVMTNPAIALDVKQELDSPGIKSILAANNVEWGVQRIQAPEVWNLGYRGEGVVVAGQDTGYDWDHPALIHSYRGWDGFTANHDYNWHDAIHSGGGSCGVDSPVPCDDQWHGTHTMGTMVGEADLNQIGVAPGAQWIGCRNMSEGVGTPLTYAECFEFFMAPYPVSGTPAEGDPSKAPDIINNSWSCPVSEGCDTFHIQMLNQVVENVRAAGIMVVASAGNHGSACNTIDEPPAMYDATYAVGATQGDPLDTIAYFSSRGVGATQGDPLNIITYFSSRDTGTALLKPDIAAPGVSVRSSVPGTGYSYAQGTSMASPHVVGAIALLWSVRPDLIGQPQSTEDILNQTAVARYSTQCGDPPQTVPNQVYGWGRVDALNAVQSVVGTLTGSVHNESGVAITTVGIDIESSTGLHRSTLSDAEGLYTLYPASDTYTVTLSKPAYVTRVVTGINVTVGQTTTLPVILVQHHAFLPMVLHLP